MQTQDVPVLPKAVVLDVKQTVLDSPVPSHQTQEHVWRGSYRRKTGHNLFRVLLNLTRLQEPYSLLHLGHLLQPWEGAVPCKFARGSYLPPLKSTMPFVYFHELCWAWLGEDIYDIGI